MFLSLSSFKTFPFHTKVLMTTMRTIAIANQKGGSAKTTTAVCLAAALGEQNRRVLVVDLDPQHSASVWLSVPPVDKGVFSVFVENGNLTDILVATACQGVTLAPATTWLVGIERVLAGEVGAETLLRRALSVLDPGAWDYLLLDTPPTLGLLTLNALAAASELLVTIEAHIMALHGLAQLLQTVEVVKQRLNADLVISGMLACRVDHRTRHAQEVVEELRRRFGNVVYNVVIRENVRLAECPSFAQPITQYAPTSTGAQDYRALAQEVMQQESKPTQT
jgi:chromosome partitioning protein